MVRWVVGSILHGVDPLSYFSFQGARCSSVVRAFAHVAIGRRIDPSWGGPIELFLVPARCSSVVRAFAHEVSPFSYFSFWCNKGCGMCYPVCGMVHIKEPLLLIGTSSHVAAAGFLSLSEWYFTICPMPYNRK